MTSKRKKNKPGVKIGVYVAILAGAALAWLGGSQANLAILYIGIAMFVTGNYIFAKNIRTATKTYQLKNVRKKAISIAAQEKREKSKQQEGMLSMDQHPGKAGDLSLDKDNEGGLSK